MSFRVSAGTLLLAIILLALLIRLPPVSFGLPYHLYGDEEVNVYGALQMIQLHTALPVLHPKDFTILYEPPALAYVYALLYLPTIAIAFAAVGFHNFHHFTQALIVDPTIFWYVGRIAVVFMSLFGIYLIYKIAQYFFENTVIALLSALFLALSFFDTTLANTTRHWTPGTIASLFSLYVLLRAFRSQNKSRWLVAAGAALGLAFGFSYLVLYLPFLGILIIYHAYTHHENLAHTAQEAIIDGLWFGASFAVVALILFLVHPYPLYVQAVHHVIPSASKSIDTFLLYYLQVLWDYETPLLIFSTIGFGALAFKRDVRVMLITLFFIGAFVPMYIFLPNIERYVLPLVPILALLAGYGLFEVVRVIPTTRKALLGGALVAILLIYAGVVFSRYEVLTYRNDTRVLAKDWIEANIEQGSEVITNSDRLRLFGTSQSLKTQYAIAPDSLRAPDRVLMQDDSYAQVKYPLFTIYPVGGDKKQAVLKAALAYPAAQRYIVEDSWATSTLQGLPSKTLVKQFIGNSAAGLDQDFIGGDQHSLNGHVLHLLYDTQLLGPDVSIYRLN